jgi:drug/metabolite transporter (DMT)-like permease
MPVMDYVWGALAGLAFGSAVAYLNSRITKHYLDKNRDRVGTEGVGAVMGVNGLRQVINVAALAIVFFLRNVLPLPFYAVILGTAAGLTAVSFLFIWRLSKNYGAPPDKTDGEENP